MEPLYRREGAFWLDTLACPRCGQPLDGPSCCPACGLRFESEDGVPRLVAPGAVCEVRFEYADDGAAGRLLPRVLTDAPCYAGRDRLPYHLDAAHARCLAACPAGSRVLEIGCGGAQNRAWVRRRGLQYVGTDVSRTRVPDRLRRHGGPDLLCDAHFLPFRDRQFDVVYCAAVTEHLPCPQRVAQEVFRVLKPGGYYLGNVSFLEPWHDNSFFHMTPLGVVEMLLRARFTIDHVWASRGYSGFQALPAMAFRRLFKAARRLGMAAQGLYRVQMLLKNLARRLRGQDPESLTRLRAIVAGATDWIARRPPDGATAQAVGEGR